MKKLIIIFITFNLSAIEVPFDDNFIKKTNIDELKALKVHHVNKYALSLIQQPPPDSKFYLVKGDYSIYPIAKFLAEKDLDIYIFSIYYYTKRFTHDKVINKKALKVFKVTREKDVQLYDGENLNIRGLDILIHDLERKKEFSVDEILSGTN